MVKTSPADRRAMLGRLALELSNKRGPLTAGETIRLRSLRHEMDELENDIAYEHSAKREGAFERYLRGGDDLPKDDLQTIREMRDAATAGAGTGAASGGGILVPVGFQDRVTAAMKDYGPMFRWATIVDTARGGSFPWPTVDDTSVSGELLAEGQQATMEDVAPGQTQLSAFKFSSHVVRASVEFIQDQGVDFQDWLANQFAIRIERAASPYFTTGTGAAQPIGLLTAGQSAGVALGSIANDGAGGPNTIGSDDIANLEFALDPAYRRNGSFQAHSNTIAALRKVKSKQGDRIFPEIDDHKLFGYPLAASPFVDEIPAGSSSPPVTRRVLVFADVSRYVIRRVTPTLVRLKQRFADFGEIGYILFWRMDGQLIDGNNGASCQYLEVAY